MKEYIDCHKVEIQKCKYGLGVFASENIKKGDVVETGIVYVLKDVDGNLPGNEHLHTWSDDRSKWAAPSGCLAWYNHSETPNVRKIGNLKTNKLDVVALKDIEVGEELVCTYMSAKWRGCFKGKLNK